MLGTPPRFSRPPPHRRPGPARAAVLAGAATLALAACEPPDPPPVALCKFAVQQALGAAAADRGAVDFVYVSEIPAETGTRVELEFAARRPDLRKRAGAARCRVERTRDNARLRAFTLDGEPVAPALLRAIRANWTSMEDAQKLYQL